MTEKINGQGFRPSDTASTRRAEAAKPTSGQSKRAGSAEPAAAAGDRVPAGDTVNITSSGLLMSKLEEIVQRAPVVDEKRVAAIKDAIAAGKYVVDDRRIADALLKFERDVLG
jgi:negative regulator of flagellin synthesis FlgM